MNIKPCGWRVLVEVDEVEQTSKGGIVLSTPQEKNREQMGHDIGRVIEVGPTAYLGCRGCESHLNWGFEIGDRVEFRRYDGKLSAFDESGRFRYINDVDIVGVLKDG